MVVRVFLLLSWSSSDLTWLDGLWSRWLKPESWDLPEEAGFKSIDRLKKDSCLKVLGGRVLLLEVWGQWLGLVGWWVIGMLRSVVWSFQKVLFYPFVCGCCFVKLCSWLWLCGRFSVIKISSTWCATWCVKKQVNGSVFKKEKNKEKKETKGMLHPTEVWDLYSSRRSGLHPPVGGIGTAPCIRQRTII